MTLPHQCLPVFTHLDPNLSMGRTEEESQLEQLSAQQSCWPRDKDPVVTVSSPLRPLAVLGDRIWYDLFTPELLSIPSPVLHPSSSLPALTPANPNVTGQVDLGPQT